jgi:hypothetical protein
MTRRDPKAIRILTDAFWTNGGWRPDATRSVPPEDFEYARARGVMFDGPVSMTHDELVGGVIDLARGLDPLEIAGAFLASLSSRHLELRSVLGSYAVARLLPDHEHVPAMRRSLPGVDPCAVCGLERTESDIDWNVLNFERFKWGGVRRDSLEYVYFDLREFERAAPALPVDEDIRLFEEALTALESLPPDTTAPKAEEALRAIQSNKAEREILLDILGVCGVLDTHAHPGYARAFVPASRRELPSHAYVERTYPVCWWRAGDGVNREALAVFGLPE